MPDRLIRRLAAIPRERAVIYLLVYIAVLVSLSGLVTAIASLSQSSSTNEQSRERARAVRASQLENCRVLAEPLRKATIKLANTVAENLSEDVTTLRTEAARSKTVDYKQLFPDFDPRELHRLIHQQSIDRRAAIKSKSKRVSELRHGAAVLRNAPPCAARYPTLPNT